ncbi:ComEC/Rec2 family competence protein [Photobacterium sanguinicancri]|uniref:MBL fold metallo-hydrolase n=1 Tax=Photobacterium sanguinicancri TaxID=875932 RepID=A0AAW7YBD3_9GAMM|nr:MBL fold metallo-hydrolase [Photobacterium sanguinicancri]MDO6545205.1 MBL fold metallo-hydrolase [Photobacterium sanguinicancri]
MQTKFLQAKNGDAILITFLDLQNNERNILIDGGTSSTYQYKTKNGKKKSGSLKNAIDQLGRIDLLILTHIDDDHIAGILKWLESDDVAINKIGKVWFNGGDALSEHLNQELGKDLEPMLERRINKNTSTKQGVKFTTLISDSGVWDKEIIRAPSCKVCFDTSFTFLSPNQKKLELLSDKWSRDSKSLDTANKNDYSHTLKKHIEIDLFTEDKSIPNGSSIAFIMEHRSVKYLFLSDAHPSVVINSLRELGYSKENKLKVEFVKVSHHGSKHNTSYELLSLIDTNRYIFSSNGDIHKLPHKCCIARIINDNNTAELIFNYKSIPVAVFSESDFNDFPSFQIKVLENNESV